MRLLFVCNTLYQIIGACCIRNMFLDDEAELILTDHSVANKDICDRIQKTKLVFDKVYYVETKYLYDFDESITKKEKMLLLRNKSTILDMVVLEDKYDMFFCANAEPFTERVANYVKKTNPKAKINWFEDGLSAYYFDKCYFPNFIGVLRSIIKLWIYKVYRLTAFIDRYYVFKPDRMEWKPLSKVTKIKPMNRELATQLGIIFDAAHCSDRYNEKYIFIEDGIIDWEKEFDIKLLKKIADKVGIENILVRTHPRNPSNRFTKYGFKTNQESSIPWEIIAANIDLSDKVLITMYSQSVVTPNILLDVKTKTLAMGKLDIYDDGTKHEIFEYLNRQYFEKDKMHYWVPHNMEELDNIIREL